ncbi:hypothetical protein [Rhodoferax sp. GW822-FHT02A01]|uniref:hypothetical protein n=1 Tax=Rhodoferax sp. GW822-FHT02A01 TaxID=3141537 RepID=UPI00315CBC18
MFKLPALPSARAGIHELADFAELLAWQNNSVSIREILGYLGQLGDNEFNQGADDEDDINADFIDEVMVEIGRRGAACVVGYPFSLDLQGTVVRHQVGDNSERADVYRYLLLSTRLNMTANKVQNNIDGTQLLEELAANVLRNYLGPQRAQSFVFGTAVAGGFENKIRRLCQDIGEGGMFENIDPGPVDANDDKLDAVAWVPFTDGRAGKLVVFCQCKTGSNWKDHVTQLQPDAFLRRWTSARSFVLTPVRAFCVSEATHPSKWNGLAGYAGLLFDRLRVVDFLDQVEVPLMVRVRQWNAAAAAFAQNAMN